MRTDEEFCDVTLVSEGDHRVEAHKVILATSSGFFDKILKHNKHAHPLLYMRGINNEQMTSMLDFIYHGEVNIPQEYLDSFLKLAEELELHGLNEFRKDPQLKLFQEIETPTNENTAKNTLHGEVTNFLDVNISHTDKNSLEETSLVLADIYALNESEKSKQELQTKLYRVKTSASINNTPNNFSQRNPKDKGTQSPASTVLADSVKTSSKYEQLDATINSMMSTTGKAKYTCNECGKITKNKCEMKHHIEGKHIEGFSHGCNQCAKSFRSRNSLSNHKSIRHNRELTEKLPTWV